MSSNNNCNQERPHHNQVTDLTNMPTSPAVDDKKNQGNENPYTVRPDNTQRKRLITARRRSSLFSPTQNSTLVSCRSTDIESNEIRPIEAGHSEPPSRTGTPNLQHFSISSPSDLSLNNTMPTLTSSELRGNPILPPVFQQRQDFNFVQEDFRVQPIKSPNSSLW